MFDNKKKEPETEEEKQKRAEELEKASAEITEYINGGINKKKLIKFMSIFGAVVILVFAFFFCYSKFWSDDSNEKYEGNNEAITTVITDSETT